MSAHTDHGSRSLVDLQARERALLRRAHRRLCDAVAAYEQTVCGTLRPDALPLPKDEIAEAQARIEDAEEELWRLRYLLLGWARPAWAPRAVLVSDWFSREDAVYDDLAIPS